MLWVEPSSRCNLDCPDCPTAAGRGGGVMQLKDFIRVLDQAPWLKVLNLWHRGEPLIATDFPAMAAEAARRGVWTQTYTNGTLLSGASLAEEIVRSGLNRITISIDGADEETYTRIRRGGNLAQVEAGVRALVDARRKLNVKKPQIIAECLVSRQTSAQFRTIRDLAFKWGCDKVLFKTYKIFNINDMEAALGVLPDDPKLWRYTRLDDHLAMDRRRHSCRRLAYSTVVAWNGEVLPCCFSVNDFHSMGNALKQPLKEIWRGKTLRQFQHTVNHSDRDRIPMCRNCTEGLKRLYLPEKLVCR